MRENVREGYVAPRLFCFCFFSPFPVLAQQLPCHGDDDACTGHDTLARQHRPSEAAETGIFSTLSLTTSPQDVICPLHGTTKRASERTSVKREINPKRAEGRKVLESTGKCWNHQNFILPVSSRFGVLKSHM